MFFALLEEAGVAGVIAFMLARPSPPAIVS
jgi:hypothetical protein